jgi:hypothetical protein
LEILILQQILKFFGHDDEKLIQENKQKIRNGNWFQVKLKSFGNEKESEKSIILNTKNVYDWIKS